MNQMKTNKKNFFFLFESIFVPLNNNPSNKQMKSHNNNIQGFDQVWKEVWEICQRKLAFDAKNHDNNSFYEMESRFGKRKLTNANDRSSKFHPGVDEQFFFAIDQMLQKGEWEVTHKWTSIIDYYHKPHQVSTSQLSQYDSLRISNIEGNQQEHIAKKTIDRTEFTNIGDLTHGYDIKISLSQEIHVSPMDLKTTDCPSLVRIKHRKSYFLKEKVHKDLDMWLRFRYDLTCVWEDETKPKAETKLMKEEGTVYEIEIEFEGIEPKSMICCDKWIVDYATHSFISKLSDLISNNSSFKSFNSKLNHSSPQPSSLSTPTNEAQ